MPATGKRQQILDDIEVYARRKRRRHYKRRIQDQHSDLPSSDGFDLASDAMSDASAASGISGISGISAESGVSAESGDSADEDIGDEEDDDEDDLSDEELLEQLYQDWTKRLAGLVDHVMTQRVLNPGEPIPKLSQLPLLQEFRRMSPDRFRKKLRVEPAVFDHLVSLIADHPVFHNNSNCPQLPVPTQLIIFLVRAGHYGNLASPEDIAQWAGVSVGTVTNATQRCLIALVSLHDRAVHLPTDEDKQAAKEYVESESCPEWRDGFLLADGTKIPLFSKPGLHGEAWFDKDKNYSLDAQIISLPHNLLIVDYSLGHTGSVHDSWAFQSTRVFKEHERIFAPGEWLWADSAYPPTTWTVAPFKKPIRGQLTADQKTFNYHISKIRIRVEHTMGMLKGRWQSLQEMRVQMSNQRRNLFAVLWIRVCIILHNLILRFEGDNFDNQWREELWTLGAHVREQEEAESDLHAVSDSDGEEEGNEAEVRRAQRGLRTVGENFRLRVMDALFDSPDSGVRRRG